MKSDSQRLPIRVLQYWLFKSAIIVLFVQFLFGSMGEEQWLRKAIVLTVMVWVWQLLYHRSFFIKISDTKIEINSGVMHRRSNQILLAKIQNASYKQGFIARMFGIGRVQLWRTGSSEQTGKALGKADAHIDMPLEEAKELTAFVLAKK